MDILDKAKLKSGSDYMTAKDTGIPFQHISHIRNGRKTLSPEQAGRLADYIGEPWILHVLEAHRDTARTPKGKRYWQGKLTLLAKTLGQAALAVFLGLTNPLGDSNNGNKYPSTTIHSTFGSDFAGETTQLAVSQAKGDETTYILYATICYGEYYRLGPCPT